MKRNIKPNINIDRCNAYSGTAYMYASISVDNSPIFATNIEGATVRTAPDDMKGGIIVFPLGTDAVLTDIERIAQKYDPVGWTIGRFFKGLYIKDGNNYHKFSLSVEILGVSDDTLIEIAEEFCKAFNQKSVLIKSYSERNSVFVVNVDAPSKTDTCTTGESKMQGVAFHLRQDGKIVPVTAHIYCSGDGTLMGEAEAAELILATRSEGEHLAKQVLDTWMGLRINKRYSLAPDTLPFDDYLIFQSIRSAQDLMEHRLEDNWMLAIHNECNNYSNMGELRKYLKAVDINALQAGITTLFDQEFCRVRYGGIYDSHGEPELWIRISSIGVSWADTIHEFVIKAKKFSTMQNLDYITICRDRAAREDMDGDYLTTADNLKVYKADDGTPYLHMPIDEYLSKVHMN